MPTSDTQPLRPPFLVYGTLRPGEPNHRRLHLAWRTEHVGTAVVPGIVMYDGGAFPYAVYTGAANDAITVDILRARDGHYDDLLADVDHLEGYHCVGGENHYERSGEVARFADGRQFLGWLYLASTWTREQVIERRGYPRIGSGDWLSR